MSKLGKVFGKGEKKQMESGAAQDASPASLSEEAVRKALGAVVNSSEVTDVQMTGGRVRVQLALSGAPPEALAKIKQTAAIAVGKLPGVEGVEIAMSAPGAPPPQAQRSPGAPPGPPPGPGQLLPEVKHVIAVASGKGGVGKSTVTANLAVALAQTGASVAVLDGDVYGPSMPIMFGVSANDVTVVEEHSVKPAHRYDVDVMSIGFFVKADDPVIWRGPMIHGAIQQFLGDTEWGAKDFLIIDLPPGTGDATLSLAQTVPVTGAIIVTTPQDVALIDARKGLAMFRKLNVPVLGIIENMSYHVCAECGHREDIFSHGGGKQAAADLNVPFLGEVPLNLQVRIGSDIGTPIVASAPDSVEAQAFLALAEQVIQQSAAAEAAAPTINLPNLGAPVS